MGEKSSEMRKKPPTRECRRFFWRTMGMSIYATMPGATLQKYGITAHPGCQGENHAAKRPVKPNAALRAAAV